MFRRLVCGATVFAATMVGIKISLNNPKSTLYSKIAIPLLHSISAENANIAGVWAARFGFVPSSPLDDPILKQICWGREFSNPIGLAAGFDKNAVAIKGMATIGFGFVEIGSVCPQSQPGNPSPRVWRLKEDAAIINCYGFNSDGADTVAKRLESWRSRSGKMEKPFTLGVNLGKNKTTENAAEDFVIGVSKLGKYADYLVINVSSPNTPNLRDLQEESSLKNLISQVKSARDQLIMPPGMQKPPIVIKIAPDLQDFQKRGIASVAMSTAVDGIIVSNTTVSRPNLKSPHKNEVGGLSGRPIFDMSTQLLKDMYILTDGKIPLIGVGGICSGKDALKKIESGASLVQLYTSMAIEGPGKVCEIKEELSALLKEKGYKSVAEAVGSGVKQELEQTRT